MRSELGSVDVAALSSSSGACDSDKSEGNLTSTCSDAIRLHCHWRSAGSKVLILIMKSTRPTLGIPLLLSPRPPSTD